MISETREKEGIERRGTGVETHVDAYDDAVGHLAIHLRGDEQSDVSYEWAEPEKKESEPFEKSVKKRSRNLGVVSR